MSAYDLNENDANALRQRILSRTRLDGECHVWTGDIHKSGYGLFKFTSPKNHKRMTVRVHRFLFYLYGFPCMTGRDVSHLCHNKACVNVNHLSLETRAINNQRKTCVAEKKCFGHVNYRDCILFGKKSKSKLLHVIL